MMSGGVIFVRDAVSDWLQGLPGRLEAALELASDQAIGWRTLGALFAIGGLLAVAAIPLAATSGWRALIVTGVAMLAVLTGVVLLRCSANLPARLMSPILGFGTSLITLVVIVSDQPDGRYSLLYVWVALQAFYFLDRREAAAHMVAAGGGYAVALVVVGGGADQWLMMFGSVVTTGWLIGALRARISRLSMLAGTDELTGLINRRGLDERLELCLETGRREQQRVSLVLLDLDQFKAVNDRLGHLEGDAVLRRFATLCTQSSDAPVARLGGDEFAILLLRSDQAAATRLGERIREQASEDPELSDRGVTVSIGTATFPAHAESARSLVQAADTALYYAKNHGRNRVVAYGPQVVQDDRLRGTDARGGMNAVILLSETLDLRDTYTSRHSQTVARYATIIAQELGLSTDRQERIRLAGIVHDLGKIGIPDHILRKPGKLTDEEWSQIRRHPELGARILEGAGLADLAGWVRAHHERPDGAGYPLGLAGEAIALEARILAVADAYEAMTSDRPYREALPTEAAFGELERHRGSQFDPEVVDALRRGLALADPSNARTIAPLAAR